MNSIFAQMTRPEAGAYLRENRDDLVGGRDNLIGAAQRFYTLMKTHHGLEQEVTCEQFVQRVLDAALAPAAEEIREFLVW